MTTNRRSLVVIDVYPDDGESFRIEADSRDVSFWERTFHGRSVGMLQGTGVQITYLEELAHVTAKRRGQYDGNLTEFREHCAIVPVDEKDDDDDEESVGLDPTQSDR